LVSLPTINPLSGGFGSSHFADGFGVGLGVVVVVVVIVVVVACCVDVVGSVVGALVVVSGVLVEDFVGAAAVVVNSLDGDVADE